MKSKTTAIVLSVLLGCFGIDRFYLGYAGLGILKLLTCGGFGIWWVIDIVMICTGSLRPAYGGNYDDDSTANLNSNNTYTSTLSQPESTNDNMAALEKLNQLYASGAITPAEYEEAKAKILARL